MNRRQKRRWIVAGMLMAIALVAAVAGDAILARVLRFSARRGAGWDVSVRRVRARLRPLSLRVENLAVANPEGFPAGSAIEISEVYAEYYGSSVASRETRLRELRVDIAQLSLIRRADGDLNFEQLAQRLPGGRAAPAPVPAAAAASKTPPSVTSAPQDPVAPAPGARPPGRPRSSVPRPSGPPRAPDAAPRSPPPPRTYRIDRLTVVIGSMEWRDESAAGGGAPPLKVTLNRTFTFLNVTDFVEVGDRLTAALTLAIAPKMLDELLAPLWE
jgi:hypothetical protein